MRQLHVLCLSLGQVYHITRTTTVGARACPAGHAGPCLLLAPLCLCSPGWTALPALWAPNLCVVVYRMLSGTCPHKRCSCAVHKFQVGNHASNSKFCPKVCSEVHEDCTCTLCDIYGSLQQTLHSFSGTCKRLCLHRPGLDNTAGIGK